MNNNKMNTETFKHLKEETKYEEITYDDKGVLCGYTKEEGWVALEECCEECGYNECECEEELEFGCKYCKLYFDNGDNNCRSCDFDLNCYNEPEEEELVVSA